MAELEDNLQGRNRDAFMAMRDFFRTAGFQEDDIEQLSTALAGYLQEDYSPEIATMLLEETEPYKRRFGRANEERRRRGLAVMKPGDIVRMEDEYKNLFRQYGLPPNMFDQPDDFVQYIGGDVSPQEMQDRLNIARETVVSDDPFVRDTYKNWYAQGLTEGDALAAVLDPDRALPELERKARSARLSGYSQAQGLSVDQARAEELANLGVDASRADLGQVADLTRRADQLSGIYGSSVGQRQVEDAVLLDSADALEEIRKLGSKQRAEFSQGSATTNSQSFGTTRY